MVPKKNRPAVKERRACCGYFFGQLDRMEREVGGTDGGSRIPFFFLSPLLFICASKTHVEGGPFPFESKQLDEWTSRTQFFSFFSDFNSTAKGKEYSRLKNFFYTPGAFLFLSQDACTSPSCPAGFGCRAFRYGMLNAEW